jgi:hypothetical protein
MIHSMLPVIPANAAAKPSFISGGAGNEAARHSADSKHAPEGF